MIRKFKNITSLFLLLIFLLPTIGKLVHHHEHFLIRAKNEKQFQILHEKCTICSFEFSVFSSDTKNIDLEKEQLVDKYCNNYKSFNYPTFPKYSFLLRAPPFIKQI